MAEHFRKLTMMDRKVGICGALTNPSAAVFVVLLGLLFSLQACAPCPPVPPVETPDEISRQERVTRLRDRTDFWQAYQAKLLIRIEGLKGKYRIRSLILTELPDQLRLEATNLFGQTIGVLVMNPKESSLWIPSKNTLYTAEDTGVLVEHLFGISLPPEILAYSLAATVPPAQIKGDWQAHYDTFPWRGYSVPTKENWVYTWKFLSEAFALKAIDIAESSRHYTISYEPAVEMDVRSIPKKIVFSSRPSSEWQMEVTIDQMQQITAVQPSLFVPSFAGGAQRLYLNRSELR